PSHQATALGCLDSVRDHHPDADFALLTIDGAETPPAPVRGIPLQACVPAGILEGLRSRYSAAELCFAAKPFLLAHLLAAGADQVHYLDGDCLAFAPLDALRAQLA